MNHFKFDSLGQTWVRLVEQTCASGARMANEGFELIGVSAEFPANCEGDEVLQRHGNPQMMAELEKVFFSDGPNALGHSYAGLLRGPDNRNDLHDVIELLRQEPQSKRAVVMLTGRGHGKVPCLNTIQFLVRDGALRVIYFARGQDVFKKFYGDALCVAKMARTVAAALAIPAGSVTAFIGSAHVYDADLQAIHALLDQSSAQAAMAATGGRA